MSTATVDPAIAPAAPAKPTGNGVPGRNGYEPNMVLATRTFDVVGTRPVRHDGADKVTGRALYGADVQLSGMLHGAILRSPHAHARILSIDTSRAEAMDGVLAVVTAEDLPPAEDKLVDVGEGDTRLSYVHGNILAKDKVLYQGPRCGRLGRSQSARRGGGGQRDRGSLRAPPEFHDRPRGDAVRRGASARGPSHEGVRRGERKAVQRCRPLHVVARRCGTGLRELRRHGREDVRHGYRAPGIHRAPQRDCAVESRRPPAYLVLHAGSLRRPRRDGQGSGTAGVEDQGDADGDRRRLRRQDSGLQWSRWRRCCPRRPGVRSRSSCRARTSSSAPVPRQARMCG